MNRRSFEERGKPEWEEFEEMLAQVEDRRKSRFEGLERLPSLFRQVCADLALAEHRLYGRVMTERLNALVIRGYNAIYKPARPVGEGVLAFYGRVFPRAVRRHARLFWFNMMLFWGGFFAMMISVPFDPIWVQSVLGPEGMHAMESMHGGGEQVDGLRDTFGSNFLMFCFYISNNVGIDFMTFAGGILGGLGTVIFMIFNGVYIGAATGYVNYACDPEAFYSFVSGHSSFELLAAVISGTAGMILGLAVLKPGRRSRRQAIVDAGRAALPLLLGAASMTFVAACIEGFWSPRQFEPVLKYSVGIVFWVLVTLYLLLAGRAGDSVPDNEY